MSDRKWETMRIRAEAMGEDARRRWAAAGEQHSSVGLIEGCYRRDQAAFGTVLGSAIALRVFLFIVPANVAVISLVHVVRLGSTFDRHFEASVTTGSMAVALRDLSWGKSLSVFLSSFVLTMWAGRSMARVLATSAAVSWQLPSGRVKQRLVAVLSLIAVFFASVFASSVFSRLRDDSGVALSAVVWMAVLASFAVAWFIAMLTLPRGTHDPGALLPGAILFGVGYTALQWFMQLYLPRKIERTSDTFGQLATTVASLGNFFFLGRLMSATFVFSAVLYEQHGSLSSVLFGLPGVRRLPQRFPALRDFFALDATADTPHPIGADE